MVDYSVEVDPLTFAAFVTRGIEDVAAQEIAADRRVGRLVETRTKVVLAESADTRPYASLRTVDDVAIVGARSETIEGLDDLVRLVADADLPTAVEHAGRTDRQDGTFSVTVSAARTACGPASEIEQAVARAVADRHGWKHLAMQRAPVDVRVFIDENWGLIGVRLFDEPLSRRSYRVANVRGSLRPTVAAALVRIATLGTRKQRVWDAFCGSGTILCEAAELGHEVWGTDIELEAVNASRENISEVKREFWGRIEQADSTMTKTWTKHRTATAVVSNLPWGKQVGITSKQALYDTVSAGVADVARRGGTGVLLTAEPKLIMQRLRRSSDVTVEERRIGLLGQTPSVLVVRPAG